MRLSHTLYTFATGFVKCKLHGEKFVLIKTECLKIFDFLNSIVLRRVFLFEGRLDYHKFSRAMLVAVFYKNVCVRALSNFCFFYKSF